MAGSCRGYDRFEASVRNDCERDAPAARRGVACALPGGVLCPKKPAGSSTVTAYVVSLPATLTPVATEDRRRL